MKKLLLLIVGIVMISACQEQQTRYTQKSAEIDAFKALVSDYEKGDWDSFKSYYSADARIFRNSIDSITVDQSVETNKESLAAMSSYRFMADEGDMEMVVTDEGETWVNFWGVWQGTMKANDQEFKIPVHITAQYKDGKIVRSYGYWDNAPIAMAQMALEAAAKASDSTSME